MEASPPVAFKMQVQKVPSDSTDEKQQPQMMKSYRDFGNVMDDDEPGNPLLMGKQQQQHQQPSLSVQQPQQPQQLQPQQPQQLQPQQPQQPQQGQQMGVSKQVPRKVVPQAGGAKMMTQIIKNKVMQQEKTKVVPKTNAELNQISKYERMRQQNKQLLEELKKIKQVCCFLLLLVNCCCCWLIVVNRTNNCWRS